MARRGRFMSGGTGGSNMSQLIYGIIKQQMSRQMSGMMDAYQNQTDWRGNGVPTAEEVIAYLQEYSGNNWVTQADRDTIMQNIATIRQIEDTRIESGLVAAINADPSSITAVQDYIVFLKGQIDTAASDNLAAEAKAKLFTAISKLAANVGEAYSKGTISSETFDGQQASILKEFGTTSGEYKQLLTTFVTSRYNAEYKMQNTMLTTAASGTSAEYLAQLREFKTWAANSISSMAEQGLATLDENGDVIQGIDAALDAQNKISSAESKISSTVAGIAKQGATDRFNAMLSTGNKFLKLVNQTLGSSYKSVTEFASNQIDVQRFYSNAPQAVMSDKNYLSEQGFLSLMFGTGNSLLTNAKASGQTASYKALNDLSKNYGRKTIVDDAAILLTNWMDTTGSSNHDAITNTAAADKLIADYTALIAKEKGNIPATELLIHENTLKALIAARTGQAVDFPEMSAFDLANPYSNKYDEATGGFTNVFQQLLTQVTNDAATANDVAGGGKIISGAIGADGKWTYGAALAEGRGDTLTYMDPGSNRVMAVLPTRMMGVDADGKAVLKGYLFDLGNGKFVIKAVTGANESDLTTYAQGYDPFTKTGGLTLADIKSQYLQQIPGKSTTGETSISTTPDFVIPDTAGGASSNDANSADATDIALSGLKSKIAAIPRSLANADIVDRRIATTVAAAEGGAAGTSLAPYVSALYGGVPAFSTGGTASVPSLSSPGLVDFRAGERAALSDNLTSYAFRNTPIADFFGTPAGQAFRAGERDMTIKPIAAKPPVSVVATTAGKGGGGV